MELTEQEREALKKWMDTDRLLLRDVALRLDVNHTSVMKWLNGRGIRSAQRAALMEHLKPYLAPPSPLLPAHSEIRPSLQPLYARLCELEDGGSLSQVSIIIDQLTPLWPASQNEPQNPKDLMSQVLGSQILKSLGILDSFGRRFGPDVRISNDGRHFVEVGKGKHAVRIDCTSQDEAEVLFNVLKAVMIHREAKSSALVSPVAD